MFEDLFLESRNIQTQNTDTTVWPRNDLHASFFGELIE